MAFASFGFILDGIVFLLRFLYEIQIDTRTNTRADMQQLKGSFALMGQYFPVFLFLLCSQHPCRAMDGNKVSC
jgi:hypothetical protein